MTRVRVDLNISLDGFATTTDQTPENPFGDDWGRLTAAYVGTRTFRERVLHDASGAGTTGVDDDYAARYFEAVGAEIMGAAMFGLHEHPDDPAWKGWWGDEPPFRVPVFILTHSPRGDRAPAPGSRHPALGRPSRTRGGLSRDHGGRAQRDHPRDVPPLAALTTAPRHYLRSTIGPSGVKRIGARCS